MTNIAFLIRAGLSLLALSILASLAHAGGDAVVPVQTRVAVPASGETPTNVSAQMSFVSNQLR